MLFFSLHSFHSCHHSKLLQGVYSIWTSKPDWTELITTVFHLNCLVDDPKSCCWHMHFAFSLLQTLFIISLCNNQLLYLMEKELIWIFGHIPGFSASLPSVIAKLHSAKDKYLSTPTSATSSSKMEVGILLPSVQNIGPVDWVSNINFFSMYPISWLIFLSTYVIYPGCTVEFLFYIGLEHCGVACACELLH